jgi:hypothetical protein
VRYQIIQVNPYFENKTSEDILGIEINGVPFEYRLETAPNSRSISQDNHEPRSVFLYNQNNLYFVLQSDWEGKYLIYEIGYPFTENKDLTYHLIDIKESNIPAYLNFSLSQDQIDKLTKHAHSQFHQFYTQYLNKNYAFEQILLEKGNSINITAYYGASLNINRFKMPDIGDEAFRRQVQNLHEFITFTQEVGISNIPDTKKIILQLSHKNYYELLHPGDSFLTSDFAIRNEKKFILIDYDYINRLLSYIGQYKKLREEKSSTIKYFREETPLLFEGITQFNDELTIDRKGMAISIFPSFSSQASKSGDINEYVLPDENLDEEYFFTMYFDGVSLKLPYDKVLRLESFLQGIQL